MNLKKEFCDLRNKIIEKEFSRLNSKQFEAVTSVNGPLLILSGAGSGKTTVLINRIVNMIKFGEAYGADCGDVTEADVERLRDCLDGKCDFPSFASVKPIAPWNILAITFTNKAANEMKQRIESLVGDSSKDIWIGTFHSICVRILRRFIDRIGFDSSFLIFDTSDQRTLIKECLKELEKVVATLEKGECTLDESIELFSKGVELTKLCNDRLNEAKLQIKQLEAE